jgi:hypothetical protein
MMLFPWTFRGGGQIDNITVSLCYCDIERRKNKKRRCKKTANYCDLLTIERLMDLTRTIAEIKIKR